MAYGEYTFDNAANSTIFFEYLKGQRETFSDVGSSIAHGLLQITNTTYVMIALSVLIVVAGIEPFILILILYQDSNDRYTSYMDPGQVLMVGTMFVLDDCYCSWNDLHWRVMLIKGCLCNRYLHEYF